MDDDVLIKIGADTSDLADAIKFVTAALQSLQDPIQAAFAAMIGPEATEAVQVFGELANKVVEFTERMVDLGRETQRVEAILGVSSQEVGKLSFIASSTGNSVNDLGIVMSRLSFNLERAERSGGLTADAVHALGLNTQALIAMPMDERLNAIADAFSHAAAGAGTTQAAIELLGRTGIQMLPFFAQGSQYMKEMGEIAQRTGSLLNDDLVAAFEQTRLKVFETSEALRDGLSITIFAAFEPAINAAADVLNDLIEELNRALQSSGFFRDILDALTFTAKLLAATITLVIAVMQKLWATLSFLTAGIRALAHGELPDFQKEWKELNDQFARTDEFVKRIEDDLNGVADAANKIPKHIIDPNAVSEAAAQLHAAASLEENLAGIHKNLMEDQARSDLALGRSTLQTSFNQIKAAAIEEYQTKLDWIQAEADREAAINGTRSTRYQDLLNKQKEMLAQHDLDMQKLDQEQAKAELDQNRTLTDQIISEKQREAKTTLQIATDNANRQYELGQIGLAEREAAIRAASETEYQTQRQLIEQKEALDQGFVTRYAADQAEMQALDQQHALNMVKQYDEAIKAVEAKFRDYFNEVESLSNSVLSDFLHGITSWRDEWRKVLQDIVLFFAGIVEKMVLKWVAGQLAMSSISATETQTRAAQEVAADAETLPLRAANFASTITADAAAVFAGIFANLAPLMGPAAAGPAAAGQATTLGMLAAAPKFETGSWSVPNTGPATVHQGEMILPREMAEAVRNGSLGGGDVHLHVHAIDADGVRRLFENNGHHIAHALKQQARNFHPALRT